MARLACAYSFGFRKGELLAMRVNQVDLIGHTIRLWRGETKSGEPRTVRMIQKVELLLMECITGKRPDDFVFTRGREVCATSVEPGRCCAPLLNLTVSSSMT